MITLHPQVLERNGEKAFVVLSYEEFLLIEETLQEFADLKLLRAAKSAENNAPTRLLSAIKTELSFE